MYYIIRTKDRKNMWVGKDTNKINYCDTCRSKSPFGKNIIVATHNKLFDERGLEVFYKIKEIKEKIKSHVLDRNLIDVVLKDEIGESGAKIEHTISFGVEISCKECFNKICKENKHIVKEFKTEKELKKHLKRMELEKSI